MGAWLCDASHRRHLVGLSIVDDVLSHLSAVSYKHTENVQGEALWPFVYEFS